MIDFKEKIQEIKTQNLYRQSQILSSPQGVKVVLDKQNIINFSSNDYLSLANDKRLKEALIKGVEKYGIGSGASHAISGHFEVHEQLENALSDYCGTQSALLFSSGYLANFSVFSALKNELAWVVQDKLNHISLLDANQLIKLPTRRYVHNNLAMLRKKITRLKQQYPQQTGLIASDVIFSMEGDSAGVKKLQKQAQQTQSLLLLDGAHSFGLEQIPISTETIYMATFGKALGTSGAFITGYADMIDYIRQKGRSYIYTTALPPVLCYATLKSLEIVKSGQQQQKLRRNIAFFKKLILYHHLNFLPSDTAIQPIIIGDNKRVISIQKRLKEQGFLVAAIRWPTVIDGSQRLRISLNANHTQSQIEQLLISLNNALA